MSGLMPCAAAALALAAPAAPAVEAAEVARSWSLQLEFHGSLFADIADRSLLAGTYGPNLKLVHRWGPWGVWVQIEHDFWLSTELESEVVQGAYNVGVGGEYIFFEGRARAAVALGPSILAYDTVLDDKGTVGLFMDARPLGLRWDLGDGWLVGLDPIGFAVVAPVLDGIPLVQFEYRTTVYGEYVF